MKKIVCLIPLYNEQEVLGALFLRLGALFDSLCARYEMSALLVDDGSADGSLALLREQHARDGRFRFLSLSRNFGKEAAMMAGFDALGTADAVIVLDADLQDPPELIPQMLELFEQGYDDVYARCRYSRTRAISACYRIALWQLCKNCGKCRAARKACFPGSATGKRRFIMTVTRARRERANSAFCVFAAWRRTASRR